MVKRGSGSESTTPLPAARETPATEFAELQDISGRVREITRANERLFEELLEGERRFRRLARAVWRVQEEERRRLARELHDGIGQTLTALKNQLEYLDGNQGKNIDLHAELQAAATIAGEALADTRELSRLLRPPILDELGLGPALRWLARRLRENAGLNVELDCQDIDESLSDEYETLVFRVVQESLTNVVKHADVSSARVHLRTDGEEVRVEISDQGRGFDPAAVAGASADEPGCGLRGISDRVELFGGWAHIDSAKGEGTTVRVFLPRDERRER